MIQIAKSEFEKMVSHARREHPREACGLVAGYQNGTGKMVKKVYCLTNCDHSENHFSLDVREQLDSVRQMRKDGMTLLGNWHSHPRQTARMSEEDKRLAYDEDASYLILSLARWEQPVLRSYVIHGKKGPGQREFLEETVTIV